MRNFFSDDLANEFRQSGGILNDRRNFDRSAPILVIITLVVNEVLTKNLIIISLNLNHLLRQIQFIIYNSIKRRHCASSPSVLGYHHEFIIPTYYIAVNNSSKWRIQAFVFKKNKLSFEILFYS